MKNKRTILAVGIGGVLIAVVILVGVYLIASRQAAPDYDQQLTTAKQYLEDKDYDKAEELLLLMIEEEPEESESYIQLSQMYLDQGRYYDAKKTAWDGYLLTRNVHLQSMVYLIDEMRNGGTAEEAEEPKASETENEVVEGTDSESLTVRYVLFDDIALHCYQQYVNDYGEGSVESAGDDGYRVKFGGLAGYAYFKNSGEQSSVVDTVTRKISPEGKPYKLVLQPSALLIGYEGYISYGKLQEIFGIESAPAMADDGLWYVNFDYHNCSVSFETDSAGNVYGETPYIGISPLDLTTTDWEGEEEEPEEEEEEDTFELGGNIYTYDVTDIYITNTTLSDISELSNCKKLRSLYLINCGITDISPLSGCDSLVELCLDGNPFSDLSPLSGLKNLRYLQFHESKVTDLSPIYDLDLDVMNPCSPGVTLEQVEEYMRRHPDCTCYWDYYRLN